ncbi:DNA recombination protein RmuC, partial [Francisella tularensis]
MILAIALIMLLIIFGIIFFLIINKKTAQVDNIRQTFEQYKNSTQEELVSLLSKEITFDTLLNQEKQKNTELKHDSLQRIDELKLELKLERDKAYNYIEEIKNYKSQIATLETQLREQNNSLRDKIELLQNSETKLKSEFENLANKIFEDSSKKLTERNQESLNSVLNPVKEQLRDFKQKVEDVYDKESNARSALQNELKTLKELNQKMTTEAHNLTNALRNSTKQQGIWGEMILENVLEKSGLRKGFEYFREKHATDEEGKVYRPDVVVKLPDNRDIIIDAKTSLFAYNDYMADADDHKHSHLKAHIKSIREHIKGLANKNYE